MKINSVQILIILCLVIAFQNCSNARLSPRQSTEQASTLEQPTPPTLPRVEPTEGNYGPPGGYNPAPNPSVDGSPISCGPLGCSFSVLGSSWIGARDSNTSPINIAIQANQYISFYFTTPNLSTTDAHIGYLTTRVGVISLNQPSLVFTISRNMGQIQTDLEACTNRFHPAFLNWSLGDNARADTCHLLPNTKYYINIAQRNALDSTSPPCVGNCNTKLYKNIDQLVVNEGYAPKPNCRYQPADSIFAREIRIRTYGAPSFAMNSDPNLYTLKNIFRVSGDDGHFRPGHTFFTAVRLDNFTALKFRTPKFTDEYIGTAVHYFALPNQSISASGWNIMAGGIMLSMSECPGDFESKCASSTAQPYASGMNILHSNGEYLSQQNNGMCVLKPDTDYYFNLKYAGDPEEIHTQFPDINAVMMDNTFYGEGKLWVIDPQ